ncbi:MAG: hypothetical protein ACREGI_03950 [Candidatus Levyibacteriota bacterium]
MATPRETLTNIGQFVIAHGRIPQTDLQRHRFHAAREFGIRLADLLESNMQPQSLEGAIMHFEDIMNTLVFPDARGAMEQISQHISLPQGAALVLLGSGSSGGAYVRALAGQEVGKDHRVIEDLDMVLVHSGSVTQGEANLLLKDVKKATPIPLCENAHIGDAKQRITNIEEDTPQEFAQRLQAMNPGELSRRINEFYRFFFPSFPAEVNMQNRRKLLQAMYFLRDTEIFERVKSAVSSMWGWNVALDEKYIAGRSRGNHLISDVNQLTDQEINPLKNNIIENLFAAAGKFAA